MRTKYKDSSTPTGGFNAYWWGQLLSWVVLAFLLVLLVIMGLDVWKRIY